MAIVERYELTDRYTKDDGRVFLSGSQALARIPLEQLRADRAAGWNTAAFVSGYPGSPLAGYDGDAAAVSRSPTTTGFAFVVQPGLNEELAATAVMGSQLAVTIAVVPATTASSASGTARRRGSTGPATPSATPTSPAPRHAAARSRSSATTPPPRAARCRRPATPRCVDLHIPLLYPGDVQEAVDLGRHAIALSRACGLWTSLKIVESVADGTGTVDLSPIAFAP